MRYSVFGKGNEIFTKGVHIRGYFFGKKMRRDTCLWTGFSEIGKTLNTPPPKKNKNIKVIVNTIHKQVHGRNTWHTCIHKQVHGRDTWHTRVNIV